MKILILGHNGMLGHVVLMYFKLKGYEIQTLNKKWSNEEFKEEIKNSNANFLINCIGVIPQKNPNCFEYTLSNVMLPIWLADNFKGIIIHPGTDCEFDGNLESGDVYTKKTHRNAEDAYGSSKAYVSLCLEKNYPNVKQIRTSIIGPEKNSKSSLWEWLVNSSEEIVNGFKNVYWNGITTLQWAEICELIIKNPDKYGSITQVGTIPISKYKLLSKLNSILNLNKMVVPIFADKHSNKCLESDFELPTIDKQIDLLKDFQKKYLYKNESYTS